MGSQLTLPNFWIGIIGEQHRRHTVCDDPCLLQLLVISPDMIQCQPPVFCLLLDIERSTDSSDSSKDADIK